MSPPALIPPSLPFPPPPTAHPLQVLWPEAVSDLPWTGQSGSVAAAARAAGRCARTRGWSPCRRPGRQWSRPAVRKSTMSLPWPGLFHLQLWLDVPVIFSDEPKGLLRKKSGDECRRVLICLSICLRISFGAFQELWLHQRCTNNWLEMC